MVATTIEHLLVNIINYCSKDTEQFTTQTNKPASILGLLIMSASIILSQVFLLLFGQYLWNNVLINLFDGVRPITNMFQLLGLSLLLRLLVA